MPSSVDVVGSLKGGTRYLPCVDEYGAFSDAAPEIVSREVDLLKKADLVLVCSSALLASKREHNPRTYLVTHGVWTTNIFVSPQTRRRRPASELRDLPRPVPGISRLLADWVDLGLIAELARKRPDWSVVLVGRKDTDLAPVAGVEERPRARASALRRSAAVPPAASMWLFFRSSSTN